MPNAERKAKKGPAFDVFVVDGDEDKDKDKDPSKDKSFWTKSWPPGRTVTGRATT